MTTQEQVSAAFAWGRAELEAIRSDRPFSPVPCRPVGFATRRARPPVFRR